MQFYFDQGAHVILVTKYGDADGRLRQATARAGFVWLNYEDVVPKSAFRLFSGTGIARLFRMLRVGPERRAIRELVEEHAIDLVVVSAGQPGAFMGALQVGAPAIYIMHTYPHGRKQRLFGRYFFRRAIPDDVVIATVSDFAKEAVTRTWRLEGRSNPVARIYSTAGPAIEAPEREGTPLEVLTAGAVEGYKDPQSWIEMARTVATEFPNGDVRFTWVGDGSLLEECRSRVTALKASEYIEFVGAVTDVDAFYDDCDVYVQLSVVESLGLAVLDAGRRGIPSLVSDVGGLPEIVEDGINGCIASEREGKSPSRLLSLLLADEALRRRMGKHAQEGYLARFSTEAWTASMIYLHTELTFPDSHPS
jgi:glycosyltransferase involved in cell wall biosynthesis